MTANIFQLFRDDTDDKHYVNNKTYVWCTIMQISIDIF